MGRRTRTRARDERHRQWIGEGNESARALLEAAGYKRARSFLRMARTLDHLDRDPRAPAGIRIRPVVPDRDARTLHALNEVSFAGRAY